MKVLHINSYYSTSGLYKNLYNKQVELGHDINVYVPVTKNFKVTKEYGSYTTISKTHGKYDRYLFF